MSLAIIANIPNPNDIGSFTEFALSDMDSHRKIVAAIYVQKGLLLPLYITDPISFDRDQQGRIKPTDQWFYNEFSLHSDMNGITGVPGSDLSYADVHNPEQWATWIRLHFYEHQQNEQVLRILG